MWCHCYLTLLAFMPIVNETGSDDKAKYSFWFGSYPWIGQDGQPSPAPHQFFADHKALVCQVEIGKENGYKHWQFMVQPKDRYRFSELKGALLAANVKLPVWLRGLKATQKLELVKCFRYCQKEDTRVEGTQYSKGWKYEDAIAKKGARTDLASFREFVKSNNGLLDLFQLDSVQLETVAKYPRFTSQLVSRVMAGTKRANAVFVCLWGETGTGKTARAFLMAKDAGYQPHQVYVKDANSLWWDGYDATQHRVIIVDEVRCFDKAVCSMLLEQTNPGYIKCEQNKGGYVPIIADMWFFTSPVDPSAWVWTANKDDKSQQFVRRFGKHIYHCTEQFVHPDEANSAPREELLSAIAKWAPVQEP